MRLKNVFSLLFVGLMSIGCSQNSDDVDYEKEEHAQIMQNCAADIKELNNGKAAEPTREISHNVDIIPGALQFPTMFCYYASLLSKMNEFDIEKNYISNESPKGKALLGKKVGEVAIIKTPVSQIELKVLQISRAE